MQRTRGRNITSVIAALVVLCADALALVDRMHQSVAPPLSVTKLIIAVILQAVVVFTLGAYVAWLQDKSGDEQLTSNFFDSPKARILQLFILFLVGAFATNLFYNGAVCGDRPLPTVRGVGLCS